MINKRSVKQMLGEVPYTAEIYWLLRQRGRPLSRSFSLRRIQNHLPEWKQQSAAARKVISQDGARTVKRILIFATLRYWIEHGVLLGMALNGQGHDVTMAYLPYANWRKPLNEFDQRRQDLYARSVLDKTMPVMQSVSFYEKAKTYASSLVSPYGLPQDLAEEMEAVSVRDAHYTLHVEEIDLQSNLYHTRLRRNLQAAHAVLDWIQSTGPDRPQVIMTPNGSILEMGAVYALSRYLEIPVVTYEFGEQRDRIWLAKNMEVMQQESSALWDAYRSTQLTENQWGKIRALFAARQGASLWENFSRRWQGQPSQGGDQVRESLGLDERPIVLLAANVIGDSLTLGRQVFSESMTEWLERTVRYFHDKSGYQLVVRIHPG